MRKRFEVFGQEVLIDVVNSCVGLTRDDENAESRSLVVTDLLESRPTWRKYADADCASSIVMIVLIIIGLSISVRGCLLW